MSVHDAEPNDIYTDEHGKLWRIVGVCHEPTVIAEEVEGTLNDPNAFHPNFGAAVGGLAGVRSSAQIVKQRKSGGVGGLMWRNWKRIWRIPPDQKCNGAEPQEMTLQDAQNQQP